jgi:fatty acid desaturase
MWIAHPADRLNVVRGLTAPVIVLAPFWYGFPEGLGVPMALAIFAAVGETNYILHLHIHRPFSGKSWLNLLLDLAMGLATGMTATNWRIQHRYGHHRGVDAPYRPDRCWELEKYSVAGALSYSLRSIWPTLWQPLAESFRKGIRNEVVPINYRWAFIEQALLIVVVLVLLVWQPGVALAFLLPWYATIYLVSRYVDYLNHYGCDETSEDPFARANNSLSRVFNLSGHNFGYHTAHHLHPAAHWTELPEIHRQIVERIPQRCLKTFSWSCLLLPWHGVRSWLGKM